MHDALSHLFNLDDGVFPGLRAGQNLVHVLEKGRRLTCPKSSGSRSQKSCHSSQGISQGGYWVPRAVAFEKRIAAAIADPGVVDVSTSWTASLPKPMLELLKDGHKAEFDGYLSKLLDPAAKSTLSFR